MRAGNLDPSPPHTLPTVIRRDGPEPSLGKSGRSGPGHLSEGNSDMRAQEKENRPHFLLSAAFGELDEALLESSPR